MGNQRNSVTIMKWTCTAGLMCLLLFLPPNVLDVAKPRDINTATGDQLKAPPGIGDAYDEKIIKGRPYKRKDELVQKELIPHATDDTIKEQSVAMQN